MQKITPFTSFIKSLLKKEETLLNHPNLSNGSQSITRKGLVLPESIANQNGENQIEVYGLSPYGIVPELIVNGKSYIVPMVTEEPSVIAAASYASKINQHG